MREVTAMSEKRGHRSAQPRNSAKAFPLLIHDSISMSVKERYAFPEQLVRMCITMLGCFGMIYSIQGFYDLPVNPHYLAVFSAVILMLLRGFRMINPKLGFGCILVVFASVPAALLYFREEAILGTSGIYSIMHKKILWQEVVYDGSMQVGKWDETDCIRLICDLLVIALSALLEYSDVLLAHPQSGKSGFWIRFLVTFPFLECGLYFGLETRSIAVFMLVFCWIGTIAIERRKPAKKTVSVLKKKKQKESILVSEEQHDSTAYEPAALLLLLAAAALCAAALTGTRKFSRSEDLNRKRKQIMEAYENFSLEELSEIFRHLPGSFGEGGISDEIDLKSSENPNFNGSTVLRITVGGAATADDYYLRGIVRSEYTGKGWALASGAYRKQQKLFRRLTSENRMPQTIFHSDHADELRTESGKFPVVHCDVEAVNKEYINYLPYQCVPEAGTKYRFDTEIELENKQKYSFWLMNNAVTTWEQLSENTAPSQNPAVSDYESFVGDLYLNVPDNEAMQRIREAFEPYMPDSSAPLDEKLETIRSYIWDGAEYTTAAPQTPDNNDFVEYFLHGSHKGYCAHYASAAVLLCRMSGIPARYCQGYVMTTSDFEAGRTGGDYKIQIPDYQAHAWAEIYVEGYGWYPYEFTENVAEIWHRPSPPVTTSTVTQTLATSSASSTTTTTTSATSVSATSRTAPATSGSAGTGSSGTGTMRKNVRVPVRLILNWALILASIALAVLLYIRYHKFVLRRRKRIMQDKNPNTAAEASYGFVLQLLEMLDIEQGSMTHEKFAAAAERNCKLLPAGRLKQIVSLQQEAVFSRNGVSAQQAEIIRKNALLLAREMYKEAKPLRKFWLRWGRHII